MTFYETTTGIRVMKLHYTADPDKDPGRNGMEWFQSAIKTYPGGVAGYDWQSEMEINFTQKRGYHVWPNFLDMQKQVTCSPFDVPPHWPIWAGYDYGHTNPFAFIAVAFDGVDYAYQIDEIHLRGKSVWEQAKLIKERPYFNRIQGVFADPSIWRKDQQDGPKTTSIHELFQEYGIYMRKGQNYERVDAAFIQLLNTVLWRDLGDPRFKIFNTCVNTLKEFRNVHWKQWANEKIRQLNPDYERIYTRNVDAFDALKYLMLARWRGQIPETSGAVVGSFDWYFQNILDRTLRNRYALT